MSETEAEPEVSVSASNIGGIDSSAVELRPGVTILKGRNATNRTSFLQALMAGLGSENVSLKGDADRGRVELSIGNREYTRSVERTNGAITTSGDPYLDDPTLADLFAFLLESNDARRGVARGDDLRDLIMEPVDTEEIQREIEELEAEKRRLDDKLDELESLKRELPALEQERNRIESEIEDTREELAATEAKLEDADIDETREEKAELESKLDSLRATRSELEQVRFDIETEEESIASLEQERADIESEREDLSPVSDDELDEIEARLERLRSRKETLNSTVSELMSTIQFNESALDDAGTTVLQREFGTSDSKDSVTDQLVTDTETVRCWTCGSEVERQQVESTLEHLRELRENKLEESREIEAEIDDLAAERRRLEERRDRREELADRASEIEREVQDRRQNLEALRARREALTEEIEELEADIERLEEQEYSEILDLHKEANEMEFELGRLESDLDEVTEEIAGIEARLEEQSDIEARRSTVESDLEDLRTRIERIESEAVEAFNEHMETVLDLLDYDNLERIWIERTQREVREGRRKVSKSAFDLHVVRRSASGTTYEDTVDHLSESEREVTGLVFALAGYLVHEVYEVLPFILLDSLEAIDSDRIAAFVEYLEEHAEYLLVALLPEDAAALDDDYHRITEI